MNDRDGKGRAAFHLATASNSIEPMERLLQKNVSLMSGIIIIEQLFVNLPSTTISKQWNYYFDMMLLLMLEIRMIEHLFIVLLVLTALTQ